MNIKIEKNTTYFTEDILSMLRGSYNYAIIIEYASTEDIGDTSSGFIIADEFETVKNDLLELIDFDEDIYVTENYDDYERDTIVLQNIYSSRNATILKATNLSAEEFGILCDLIKQKKDGHIAPKWNGSDKSDGSYGSDEEEFYEETSD